MNKYRVTTRRLLLRNFEMEDVNWYFECTQDEKLKEYLTNLYTYSFDEAVCDFRKVYTKCDFVNDFYLAIETNDSHQVVGFLNITRNDKLYDNPLVRCLIESCSYSDYGYDYDYDVSCFIKSEYRGYGFASEAVLGFLENLPKGKKCLFMIREDNEASLESVKKIPNIEFINKQGFHYRYLYVT